MTGDTDARSPSCTERSGCPETLGPTRSLLRCWFCAFLQDSSRNISPFVNWNKFTMTPSPFLFSPSYFHPLFPSHQAPKGFRWTEKPLCPVALRTSVGYGAHSVRDRPATTAEKQRPEHWLWREKEKEQELQEVDEPCRNTHGKSHQQPV